MVSAIGLIEIAPLEVVALEQSAIARTVNVRRDGELYGAATVAKLDRMYSVCTRRIATAETELVHIAKEKPSHQDFYEPSQILERGVPLAVLQLLGFDAEPELAVRDDRDNAVVRCLDATDEHFVSRAFPTAHRSSAGADVPGLSDSIQQRSLSLTACMIDPPDR